MSYWVVLLVLRLAANAQHGRRLVYRGCCTWSMLRGSQAEARVPPLTYSLACVVAVNGMMSMLENNCACCVVWRFHFNVLCA